MAKKVITTLTILILAAIFLIFYINLDTVDVYIDGENVSVETRSLNSADLGTLNREICNITCEVMNNTKENTTTLKDKITDCCNKYGLKNPKINIDSIIGKNQIPVIAKVKGTSMFPTLQDGQQVLINKTHNIHIGDIVVANSSEYGGIIKRVSDINGDDVYLTSDNRDITYEYINNSLYEVKGITTWVNINDINGVVIEY